MDKKNEPDKGKSELLDALLERLERVDLTDTDLDDLRRMIERIRVSL